MRRAKSVLSLLTSLVLILFLVSFAITAQVIVGPSDLESRPLQAVIDEMTSGEALILQPGIYLTNAVLDDSISILGGPGVILRPLDPSRPIIAIREVENATIQGLVIEQASIGLEIKDSSCTISDCSINTSEIGVKLLSLDSHVVVLLDCSVQGDGIGMQVLGLGTVLLSRCTIAGMGTGISIGGSAKLVASNCTVSECYDGIVVAISADAILYSSILRNNYSNGIRLAPLPPELGGATEGILCAVGTDIVGNLRWGISYSTVDGTTCRDTIGHITGAGNMIAGNGDGPACPADLLPEGFVRIQEPE